MKLLKEENVGMLNPKLWVNENLKPDVRQSLLKIKDRFLEGLAKINVPINVVDAWLVGSNASYNYTEHSDIDLHLIVDMDGIESPSLLLMIYDYYKSSFNDKHDIRIKGIETEVYVQVKTAPIISKGIYSVQNKKWIQFPVYQDVKAPDISSSLGFMLTKFEEIKELNNKNKAQSFLDTLYINRARSLAIDGEYGVDNLVFKEFRNRGYIQELKDIIVNGESVELSLEGLMGRLNESKTRSDLKDLTGQQFGELTVIGYDEEKSKRLKSTYWKCKCSCGKECSVAKKHLLDGSTKACGHLKRQSGIDHTDNFDGMRYRQNKYNTNVEVIRNNKLQPNNTSGVRGVDYHKGRDEWRARLQINGKERTKWFRDKESAIKWRKEAEKKYFQPIIDKATEEGDLK